MSKQEYLNAYRDMRRWWALVDSTTNGNPAANYELQRIYAKYTLEVVLAAQASIRAIRNYQYREQNPLWCGKWTFPRRAIQEGA